VSALRGWGLCRLGLALLLNFTSLAGAASAPHSALKPVERRQVNLPIADFILTDQGGKSFQFKNLRGKVVVVAFAYTTCPDVCPLIVAALRQVQSKLTVEERKDSYLVTVTTDPEIDSPKVLTGYSKRYGAELDTWSFLTGSETALKSVWKNFGVGVKRKGRGLVDHTPLTAIIDRHGVWRIAFIGASPDVSVVLNDIRSLLAER
jgi:protein SCO1/2